jgi:photosystem II stability/assembly factor-like uncharacterized protein
MFLSPGGTNGTFANPGDPTTGEDDNYGPHCRNCHTGASSCNQCHGVSDSTGAAKGGYEAWGANPPNTEGKTSFMPNAYVHTPAVAGLNGQCIDGGFSFPHRTLGANMLKDEIYGIDYDGTPVAAGDLRDSGVALDLLSYGDVGHSQTTWVASPAVGLPAQAFAEMSFPTPTDGWMVDGGGTIVHTSDGGVTWATQPSGTTAYLGTVGFADTQNGWVGGDNTVRKTTDGGSTWVNQPTGLSIPWRSIQVFSPSEAVVGGANETIIRTTDGGSTWTVVNSGGTQQLYAMTNRGDTVWAVGRGGAILKSTDRGASWSTQYVVPATNLWGIAFTDSQNGFAVGDVGRIYRTTDGGTNWALMTSPTGTRLRDVAFSSDTSGWIVGDAGTILWTGDGGGEWSVASSPVSVNLYATKFNQTGYISGLNGTFLNSRGQTWYQSWVSENTTDTSLGFGKWVESGTQLSTSTAIAAENLDSVCLDCHGDATYWNGDTSTYWTPGKGWDLLVKGLP